MSKRLALLLALTSLSLGACHAAVTTDAHRMRVTLEDGRLVLTESIQFETDSSQLAPGSAPVLDDVAQLLNSHSGIAGVRIEGHTDAHGTAEHNHTLSTQRAHTVAEYLRAHGVAQPLETSGFGATRPLCHEHTPECDTQNRRVEFYVTAN